MKFNYLISRQWCEKINALAEKSHILSSIFWACILFVGHHAVPSVFEFPEQIAYTIAANLQAAKFNEILDASTRQTNADIVLKVDTESAHNAPYFGEIPTQRCALAADLEKILIAKPRALVIDVDVSPTNRAIIEPSSPEAACAKKLEALLSTYGTQTVLVAIHPSQFTKSSALQAERLKWQKKMAENGLHFGSADIVKRSGDLVTTYETEGSISYVLCKALDCAQRDSNIKQSNNLINFWALKNQFSSSTTTTFSDALIHGKIVFFGFGVDDADTHLTPLGMKHGIDIHAAAYASMRDPLSKPHGLWDILVDVILGVMMGLLAHQILRKYMAARRHELKHAHPCHKHAYKWLLLLVLAAVGLCVVASYVAIKMLEYYGIWLSPIVMILAMLMDALCRAPISLLSGENHAHKPKVELCNEVLKNAGAGAAFWTLIWYASIVLVLVFTFYYLLH